MSLDRFDLTNWRKHPTAPGVEVFFFKTVEEGNYFEALLKEHKIWHEKDVDQEEDHSRKVMVAVKSTDVPKAKYLNNLAIGKYRKPFIPYKSLRYALAAFFVLIFTLLALSIIYNNK